MTPYRMIVTGARTCSDRQGQYVRNVIYSVAFQPMQEGRPVYVVQGKCPTGGVDAVAEKMAEFTQGLISDPFPADWERLGRRAGPERNGRMVAAGADICVGFPDARSVGTWDCIRQAAAAKIHVRIYPLPEELR